MYRGAFHYYCPTSKGQPATRIKKYVGTIEAASPENGNLNQLSIGTESFAKIIATCCGCVRSREYEYYVVWSKALSSPYIFWVDILQDEQGAAPRTQLIGQMHEMSAISFLPKLPRLTHVAQQSTKTNSDNLVRGSRKIGSKCSQSAHIVECRACAPLAPPSSTFTAYYRHLPPCLCLPILFGE
jgi:hypothetical protein